MKNDFQMFQWDDVPAWCPTWNAIAGKAKNYKTCRLRSTGEYCGIVRITHCVDGMDSVEPIFVIRVPGFAGVEHRLTDELCNFCL